MVTLKKKYLVHQVASTGCNSKKILQLRIKSEAVHLQMLDKLNFQKESIKLCLNVSLNMSVNKGVFHESWGFELAEIYLINHFKLAWIFFFDAFN